MSRQPHPLVTLAQLVNTPSAQDGIPKEVEDDLRVVGCMMIQEAGIMLDLWVFAHAVTRDAELGVNYDELMCRPQSTMAIAQVIFHRFFFVSSMCSFGIQVGLHLSYLKASTRFSAHDLTLLKMKDQADHLGYLHILPIPLH